MSSSSCIVGERARGPVHSVWGNGRSGQEHLVVLRDAVDVHAVLADVGLVGVGLLDPVEESCADRVPHSLAQIQLAAEPVDLAEDGLSLPERATLTCYLR